MDQVSIKISICSEIIFNIIISSPESRSPKSPDVIGLNKFQNRSASILVETLRSYILWFLTCFLFIISAKHFRARNKSFQLSHAIILCLPCETDIRTRIISGIMSYYIIIHLFLILLRRKEGDLIFTLQVTFFEHILNNIVFVRVLVASRSYIQLSRHRKGQEGHQSIIGRVDLFR